MCAAYAGCHRMCAAQSQGSRPYMEDCHTAATAEPGRGGADTQYYAVFDGHGGSEASVWPCGSRCLLLLADWRHAVLPSISQQPPLVCYAISVWLTFLEGPLQLRPRQLHGVIIMPLGSPTTGHHHQLRHCTALPSPIH